MLTISKTEFGKLPKPKAPGACCHPEAELALVLEDSGSPHWGSQRCQLCGRFLKWLPNPENQIPRVKLTCLGPDIWVVETTPKVGGMKGLKTTMRRAFEIAWELGKGHNEEMMKGIGKTHIEEGIEVPGWPSCECGAALEFAVARCLGCGLKQGADHGKQKTPCPKCQGTSFRYRGEGRKPKCDRCSG